MTMVRLKGKYVLLCLFGFLFFPLRIKAQESKMDWFENAKLGIFIHWGIYAVNGIDESWSFYNNYISYQDYMKQLNGFNDKKYNPEQWAELIQLSGAKYAVLTSKHHDGVALWNSKFGDLNVIQKTSVKKDLVGPFVDAIKAKGLKAGIYFSMLDWSHPDYDGFKKDEKKYIVAEEPKRWEKFTKFNHGQIKEIADQYNPDLWWFDGDWEHKAEEWEASKIRKLILDKNPQAIINSRLTNNGDYATPEQGLPLSPPKDKYWELCMTMNDSWGYQQNDINYKSANQIIRILVECISMGGNLLLDISPKADGSIPKEQVEILEGVGRWMSKHKGDVYEMKKGIAPGYFYGATALSKDSTILYLFLDNNPNEEILVKGLKNKVNRIWVVGNGTKLKFRVMTKPYWSSKPGLLYIDVPDETLDSDVTVIAVLLDGKIEMQTLE